MADINWRKLPVRRERRHEPLVEKMCTNKGMFNFIKELMVFAAMVGYTNKKRKPICNDTIRIDLETYASDQNDAFIYLLALMETKEGACLKDENLVSSIKIFEEYCNAGLEEITLWLEENSADHDGVDTMVKKLLEQAIKNEKEMQNIIAPGQIEPEF